MSQTSGSIRGVVNDIDGAPIPGATVIIESTALIGDSRTAYTNEVGVFRFPSVPVGTYKVQVSMDGFKTVVADEVLVKLEGSSYVPVVLRSSTTAEEVSVVGETPLIDPTESGLSTSFKGEMLHELPTQRNMWDLMQVSPGITVDFGDSRRDQVVAFGSNIQSNSWNIDGVDVTSPESGGAWYYVNPDVIEEIQVIGVGAPAEYGNHTGAVLNVVTKKGGKEFHGAANYFFQSDNLTGNNVELSGSPYGFHRDEYHDATITLGGPILKDHLWFFGSYQYLNDAFTEAGINPDFTPGFNTDKYDLKLSARLGEKYDVTGFYHNELWAWADASQYADPSAWGVGDGDNPSWGGSLTSTLNNDLLLELNYSGWTSYVSARSSTGSLEDPFINGETNPPTTSGGVSFPFTWDISRHQLKGKLTYYAENFLKAQHEFRFGVQYGRGYTDTLVAPGPNGSYLYFYGGYIYKYYHVPYDYGGIANDLGVFIDDTVNVNDRLTLNLGLRFDRNTGTIPEYDRYAIGTPSFTDAGNWIKTGEKIPGIENLVTWNLVSPRLGIVYQFDQNASSVLKGSFGVYHDHNVVGNWENPPPGFLPWYYFWFNPETEEYEPTDQSLPIAPFNKELKAPKTLQYSAGFERQLSKDSTFTIEYVYKDTSNLIGWEILDGSYEPYPFVDPFSGREYTLLKIIEPSTLRKGNSPGNFPGSEGLRYYQKYHGLMLTYERRISNNWALNASYTWSRSVGLLPRMFSQDQGGAFLWRPEGSDPNNFINAEGRLQGDRPHMFRLQGVFFNLPGDLHASAAVEFSSGRAHSRQIQVRDFDNGMNSRVIMEPTGSFRYSPIQNIDISVGRKILLNDQWELRLDAAIYNLLNSDQELWYETLALQNTNETFVPVFWVKPRRLQLRLGLKF